MTTEDVGLLEEIMLVCVRGGLRPVGGVGLREDVADMASDGVQRNKKLLADLAVAPARGDESQYLDLALRQAVWISGSGSRLRLNQLSQSCRLHYEGTHAKLIRDFQGFVQEGKCITPFSLSVSKSSVVVACPGELGSIARLTAIGQSLLEVDLCVVEVAHSLGKEAEDVVHSEKCGAKCAFI